VTSLPDHPLATIFPLMAGAELDTLAADIHQHGLREPITLLDGKILDGRNRHLACLKAGVEAYFENFEGNDPLGFVLSRNLHRRHLDESQRAMVAAKIANLPAHRPNKKSVNLLTSQISQAQAAGMLKVSTRSVGYAAEVQNKGVPELAKMVEAGALKVSAAGAIARQSESEQRRLVALSPDEIVQTANRIKRDRTKRRIEDRRQCIAKRASACANSTPSYRLYNKSCQQAAQIIEANSVDYIITDPPYPKEYLPVYDDLAALAARALRPGGSLLCMSPTIYLPQVITSLGKHLRYNTTIAYLMPGGNAQLFPQRIFQGWKPILWLVKGDYKGDWVPDVVKAKRDPNTKTFHHWGQSEDGFRALMRPFVKPGDLVVDPFLGGGTTGVVALELGATFIGFDTDKVAYNEALVRLAGSQGGEPAQTLLAA
jgi:DNA methylase